jgi:CheY-like chemotaxis protein/anti-sigma regulatory factor (Ser/Thr protein kinase)
MNYLLVVDDSLVDRQLAKRLLQSRFSHGIEFASTGWEALEQIESHLPLAVITDLQMPEMDGLELTEVVRRRFPSVPVILMTGFGSERIAIDALMRGATDYVPKVRLAGELCRAVEVALAASAESARDPRWQNCLRFDESRYELENNPALIPPLVNHLAQVARAMDLVDDVHRPQVARALFEAISNAIYHGNLELSANDLTSFRTSSANAESVDRRRQQPPYRERRVFVETSMSAQQGRFVVRDEGPGFDVESEPNLATEPPGVGSNERRGLVLIKLFMDDVRFNAQGNEITLIKNRSGGEPT